MTTQLIIQEHRKLIDECFGGSSVDEAPAASRTPVPRPVCCHWVALDMAQSIGLPYCLLSDP